MNYILHKAESRGVAHHGWLDSYHTFSFAHYYDPKRMGFGALRVINDDIIAPSMGFGTHPHKDMEIITIPLSGALRHRDSMGNQFVIQKGEVQAMYAGTGISHSEFNASDKEEVNLLQIWVLPRQGGLKPSYSQKQFLGSDRMNQFQLLVSPDGLKNSVSINQNAYFSLVQLQENQMVKYSKYQKENGVYFFVTKGKVKIETQELSNRDGLGVEEQDHLQIVADKLSEVLVMEVPLIKS